MSAPEAETEHTTPRQIPADVVAGLVMVGIAAVFRLKSGDERLDWIFPVTLSYILGGLGICLVVRGCLGYGARVSAVPPLLRGQGLDVLVFVGVVVAYVVLLSKIGFWVTSVLTIAGAAMYLDSDRSPRRLAMALGVAIAVCLAAWLLLTRVFYVPFPSGAWLPIG